MSRFEVTSIGEVILRLSVPPGIRLETAATFDVHPAGAEANVVSLLARLGRRCAWVGALPHNPLGRLATREMRLAGVDLSQVNWTEPGRVGAYYVEFAVPPRPIEIVYDRANSSAAQLSAAQIAWDYLLDTRLLHLTGITPALSSSCKDLAFDAVHRAESARVPVSFDINYREKLWPEQEAAETLLAIAQHVALLLCSATDAGRLFECRGEPETVVERLAKLTGASCVVLTLGERGVIAWDRSSWYKQLAPNVTILDRIGAGDALAAGVIHGWLQNDLAAGLKYGTILAGLALSQYGDAVVTNQEEMQLLIDEDGSDIAR